MSNPPTSPPTPPPTGTVELPREIAALKISMMLHWDVGNTREALRRAEQCIGFVNGRERDYGAHSDDFHRYRIKCLKELGRHAEAEAARQYYQGRARYFYLLAGVEPPEASPAQSSGGKADS